MREAGQPDDDIAGRLGGWDDIAAMEVGTDTHAPATDAEIIELGSTCGHMIGTHRFIHSLDPYGEIVQQSFRNSALYPLASGLSGTLSTVGLQASGPIASGLAWQSRVAYARASDQ